MAYCEYTDIQNMTGTTLGQTILEALIAQADRLIDSRLEPLGLSGGTNGGIKSASIFISMALVREYERGSGKRPATIILGGVTQTDNIDADISGLYKRAWELVDAFIETSRSTSNPTNIDNWMCITNEH